MCDIVCKKQERRLDMPTNLAIDPDLLQKALEVSGQKTKKDTVTLALKELINRRKQLDIIDLFGKMDPDPDYDYKKGRSR
jgi:Arc/MetJ family transcription regulator